MGWGWGGGERQTDRHRNCPDSCASHSAETQAVAATAASDVLQKVGSFVTLAEEIEGEHIVPRVVSLKGHHMHTHIQAST